MPDYGLFGAEHVRQYEDTGGKVGHDWNGAPVLVLHTTGRRSGQIRKFTPKTRAAGHHAMAEIAGMLERARANGPMKSAPMPFVGAMMNSVAEATMDFIVSDPAHADAHGKAAFEALWHMVAG